MTIAAIIINIFVCICLLISITKSRAKTVEALKISAVSLLKIIPTILTIILLIGLLLTFIPKEVFSKIIGENSGSAGLFTAALLGAVLHIPAIIAFPLAASLIKVGAAITAVTAFITTLTMIGVITLPLEIKEMGKKFALLRNGISFLLAIIIALIIGTIL